MCGARSGRSARRLILGDPPNAIPGAEGVDIAESDSHASVVPDLKERDSVGNPKRRPEYGYHQETRCQETCC